MWWVAYHLIRKSVGVTHRRRKKERKNGKMRESSQDKQVLPILPSVWTISPPLPNGQYEQFAKVSFNLVFGPMLWYKLCFLCLINVQKCLIFGLVYFFGRKLKWGRFCKDLVFCQLSVCMAIVIQEGHPSSVVHLCYLKFNGRHPSNKTPLILRHFSLKKNLLVHCTNV